MKNSYLLSLLMLAVFLVAAPVRAEKADRVKPMNIEADNLRHDNLKHVSVFSGRVIMTKGTIVLRGARLEVRQEPEGYQYGVVTAEPGQRAFFRQKRDGGEEFIEGEGETIEYDGRADNVKFIRRGELRRYKDGSLNDQITGDIIFYDNVTDVFTVDGKRALPGAAAAPAGRVRAMLAPRQDGTATPPAKPTTVTPAAPALRSSTRLEGAAP